MSRSFQVCTKARGTRLPNGRGTYTVSFVVVEQVVADFEQSDCVEARYASGRVSYGIRGILVS